MTLTQGLKAPVVKYQQANPGQLPELFCITAIAVYYCHDRQQTGGVEVANAVTTQTGTIPEGTDQPAFTRTTGAGQHRALPAQSSNQSV